MERNFTEMTVAELKQLCQKSELPVSGTKAELIERLAEIKAPPAERFIPGMLTCRICGKKAGVNGTSKREIGGGKIVITRQIKCSGVHKHTYPLSEIAKKSK